MSKINSVKFRNARDHVANSGKERNAQADYKLERVRRRTR